MDKFSKVTLRVIPRTRVRQGATREYTDAQVTIKTDNDVLLAQLIVAIESVEANYGEQ